MAERPACFEQERCRSATNFMPQTEKALQ